MNLIVQQFQNLKGGQEENKTDHYSPTMEGEKKINERIKKVEGMIKRDCKMEDLMDYQSLFLFPDVRLLPKFKMPTLDKRSEEHTSESSHYSRSRMPSSA